MTITASYEQCFAGSDQGGQVGASATAKVAFWGGVPAVQPTAVTAVTTTAATSTTNAYGYTTAAQADAIVTAVNALVSKLTTVGILAT